MVSWAGKRRFPRPSPAWHKPLEETACAMV